MLEMVSCLKKPRRVMMLVKAGAAVDTFIDMLVPLLDKGDIIIDGGWFCSSMECVVLNQTN